MVQERRGGEDGRLPRTRPRRAFAIRPNTRSSRALWPLKGLKTSSCLWGWSQVWEIRASACCEWSPIKFRGLTPGRMDLVFFSFENQRVSLDCQGIIFALFFIFSYGAPVHWLPSTFISPQCQAIWRIHMHVSLLVG